MATIDALPWQRRFTEALPGDPSRDPSPRPVPRACWSHAEPSPVPSPRVLALTPEVAELLGLDLDPTPTLSAVLGGNHVLDGMVPFAACYGGHQFGSWAGQLGDGRAITLGELPGTDGQLHEVQLKGAGPTPYSRRADGRAVLRSSLREFLCSEAMHHLGVPTTRALALVATGAGVERDMLYDGHPAIEPGAVVCRVAPTFLRFGSFELPASRGDVDTLRRLVRFTLERWFPAQAAATPADVAAFFAEVSRRTARLMVEWMRVGFVHGVMNTDNMSILGLTLDYGPYGWLEGFDPGWTPNTTDASGRRYRFANQPRVAQWNLAKLGEALLPLVESAEPLERALAEYAEVYQREQHRMLLGKLGLTPLPDGEADEERLLGGLFELLTLRETDMTLAYRALAGLDATLAASDEAVHAALAPALYEPAPTRRGDSGQPALPPAEPPGYTAAVGEWARAWLARAAAEGVDDATRRARMDATNPLYVPRNWLVQGAIDAAEAGDAAPLHALHAVLRRPYHEQPGCERFAQRRPEWARHRPGCSMLSCSS